MRELLKCTFRMSSGMRRGMGAALGLELGRLLRVVQTSVHKIYVGYMSIPVPMTFSVAMISR